MPVNDTARPLRYALRVALIYLLIRGVPILLLYAINALPDDAYLFVTEHHGHWLTHLYPVLPVWLMGVPIEFQLALALFPILIIEVLLVFLLSAWFLRRRPGVARGSSTRRWALLALTILIWSFAIRHQVLAQVQSMATAELLAQQDELDWLDDLPYLLIKAHWQLTAVIYATALLWTWLPLWLHFRWAGGAAEVPGRPDPGDAAANSGNSLRSTPFVSFLLGCLVLHFAWVQTVYLGLWPWAAERAGIRLDVPDEGSLLLILSQILFAVLVSALAAGVYARRVIVDTAPTVQRDLRALLAGATAYLLTCFIFLALIWLIIWLSPGLVDSPLQQLSESPQSGMAIVILLNVGALLLICIVSGRLRDSPRRWSAGLAGLILLAGVPAYVGWTLVSSNNGTAGRQPGFAVTGELGDARWRNMEQWCTGVVDTSHGTWLVGRHETASASYVPDGVQDLAQLLAGDEDADDYRGFSPFGSRPLLTTLALLQDDGRFKIMATVPEVACLVVSPESETLFLFTGVRRPPASSPPGNAQTAVFRSTDHGTTWEWLESGFMPGVVDLAWSLEPTFASEQDIWAWGAEPPGEDEPRGVWGRPEPPPSRHVVDGIELRRTALFYSADQGQTSTAIYSPEPLVATLSHIRAMVDEPTATFSSSRYQDQERFIVQVDDRRAYAWVSERTWYHVGEVSHRFMLTTVAELSRPEPDAEWSVTRVTRKPGVAIGHLVTALDGRTHAILHDDEEGERLAQLDTRNGEWIERQETPSLLPAWLAEDATSARYFWSNGDYQVVSQWGYTVLPRLLMPFSRERAEIRTDAHFYTRDAGRRWSQLAIPDYLGVMGLSPRGSKLYWSRGNWYSNDEPLQWQYDLAR